MPKLGLSLKIGDIISKPYVPPPVSTLYTYQDRLATYGTANSSFIDRQWFSSDSNSLLYGQEISGGYGAQVPSGRYMVCHFDCLKEQYPTYANGVTYQSGNILSATGVDAGSFSDGTFPIIQGNGSGGVITVLNGVISVTSAGTGYVDGEAIKAGGSRYNLVTGQVVYGGVYGHALFRKTVPAGGPPFFIGESNATDTNGWTRHRPALRQLVNGQRMTITLKIEVINPTALFYSSNNNLRVAIHGSAGDYINRDSIGPTDSRFSLYNGYLFSLGLNHKVYKRIPNLSQSLMGSMSGFTQLSSTEASINPTVSTLAFAVKFEMINNSSQRTLITEFAGYNGNDHIVSGQTMYTGDTDNLGLDTLSVSGSAGTMDSLKISEVTCGVT